jgi:hypothetical protein
MLDLRPPSEPRGGANGRCRSDTAGGCAVSCNTSPVGCFPTPARGGLRPACRTVAPCRAAGPTGCHLSRREVPTVGAEATLQGRPRRRLLPHPGARRPTRSRRPLPCRSGEERRGRERLTCGPIHEGYIRLFSSHSPAAVERKEGEERG